MIESKENPNGRPPRIQYTTLEDSDGDGISDESETGIFGTRPDLPDTDGDGINDGDEVLAGRDPLVGSIELRRGDSNDDGVIDVSDGIRILNRLFLATDPFPCDRAADSNDDGQVDLSDAVKVFAFLFTGDLAPPAPGPFDCGPDPTEDELECADTIRSR